MTARELAGKGAKVILAVRNTGKGDAAAKEMTGDVEVRQLDLQDLSSVRQFADGIDKVDVLINNAGIMATPFALTVDGFESQIGTNHLGHFALTNLLLPKLTDRVVTVSSEMHRIGRISLDDLNWTDPAATRPGRRTANRSSPTCCSPASCSDASRRPARRCARWRPTPVTRTPICKGSRETSSAMS